MHSVNNLLKDGEVQSGPSGETISRTEGGRGVGNLEASRLVLKKSNILFLESWSARVLIAPGIWDAVRVMSK